MMFLLRPYAELGLSEFGLEAAPSEKLSFTPSDFGERQSSRWMEGIGERIGQAIASPALAYLAYTGLAQAYEPRTWVVRAAQPSTVVIDFVAGSQMDALKSFQGYALSGELEQTQVGSGELRVYNLSDTAISGELRFDGAASAPTVSLGNLTLDLKAQELRIIPVTLGVPRRPWTAHSWTVVFAPDASIERASVFSTLLYPGWRNSQRKIVADFNFSSAQNYKQRLDLIAQPLAEEEPALEQDGRWLVSKGVHVEDWIGRWEFEIRDLPKTSLRPARAELPLPSKFLIPPDCLMRFDQRCESAGSVPTRYAGLSATDGGIMQIQFRTAGGNLYEVWPRRSVAVSWRTYEESADNFTMSLFGRANLPWKFRDSQPVALVFTFWPRSLPTVVAVKAAALVRPQ